MSAAIACALQARRRESNNHGRNWMGIAERSVSQPAIAGLGDEFVALLDFVARSVQFSSAQLSSDVSVILFSSDGKLCDNYWPRNVYVSEPKFRDLQGQGERQHAD
uniref:Uncharacterized protein n=1 Tax=Arundo donax TaxID=35708 RepID=A0A0A9DVX0_ARUDO